MEKKLRRAYHFIVDTYGFVYVKHRRLRWDAFVLLYERESIKIKVKFEAPSFIETTVRITDSSDWMTWNKDEKHVMTLLKDIDQEYYSSIIDEVRSINMTMNKNITDKKRGELFNKYLDMEVEAVRRYLDYLTASDGTA